MYQLYIANKNYSSWSLRPWVLMTELNIPFEERLVPFTQDSNWENFRQFNPTGLVPCLHTGSGDDNQIVWDSLAIAEYLYEAHPQVWPKDKAARSWARSAVAEMHSGFPALREICSMNCGVQIKLNEIFEGLAKDIKRLEELWQHGLESFGGSFLAGNRFTAVDAFFCPVAFRVKNYGLILSEPCLEYVDRLLALESMKNWYESALAEPWRDQSHENDLIKYGEIVMDHRIKQSID